MFRPGLRARRQGSAECRLPLASRPLERRDARYRFADEVLGAKHRGKGRLRWSLCVARPGRMIGHEPRCLEVDHHLRGPAAHVGVVCERINGQASSSAERTFVVLAILYAALDLRSYDPAGFRDVKDRAQFLRSDQFSHAAQPAYVFIASHPEIDHISGGHPIAVSSCIPCLRLP